MVRTELLTLGKKHLLKVVEGKAYFLLSSILVLRYVVGSRGCELLLALCSVVDGGRPHFHRWDAVG